MPIYAYRCDACGHAKDVLQKVSDEPLSVCPACGAASFRKQVTAAGFQLKGSGWYVTDFRNNGSGKPASGSKDGEAGGDSKADGAAGEKSAGKASEKSAEKAPEKTSDKAADKAAATPSPAPASPAAAPPAGSGSSS
jgi:putative FmdB family regulatory protein